MREKDELRMQKIIEELNDSEGNSRAKQPYIDRLILLREILED